MHFFTGRKKSPGFRPSQPSLRVTVLLPLFIWSVVSAKLMFRIIRPYRSTAAQLFVAAEVDMHFVIELRVQRHR